MNTNNLADEKKSEKKFPFDVPYGTIMDYVNKRFMLVLKDESWSEPELELLRKGIHLKVLLLDGILIFTLESQPVDSADFSFNVAECDEKDEILAPHNYELDLYFLNKENEIVYKISKTLTVEQSEALKADLQRQLELNLSEKEFSHRMDQIEQKYEPYELAEMKGLEIEL